MDSFDYVIVGGGTAGCILANRLTASGRHKVLLLEAGAEPSSMWINIPAGFSKLLTNPDYNWRFHTQAEENTLGREIAVPRGKGLGGSSLIHGMIYVRGQPQDYDRWESAGARGWGFRDVEPYFRRLEHFDAGGPTRGRDGPVHLHRVSERYPISEAFIAAAREDGQPLNDDYNGPSQEGFGYYQVTQRGGQRWSAYDAYLKPARTRANLRVETGAHVLRLEFEGARCTGVTYRRGGRDLTVRAGAEVLLAAGSVQTPQLLELSGVGSPELLQSLGIGVRHSLPGVGENYIDHFCTRMNWRVRNTVTLNEMSRGWRLARAVAQYYATRTGILTLGTGLVHGFVRTRPDAPAPDAQYFFMHASYANAAERILDRKPGMTIGVAQLRPESVGSIHARSADPFEGPAIRPNFLDCDEDCRCMVEAMKVARRIVERPAMKPYVEFEMSPGAEVQSDDEWLHFARVNGQTIYHPLGTCRMGEDERAVVDPRLRVRGIAGLRVVDASVMPKMVSANIVGAVMMVAEKAADLVLEDGARGQ
jgi:choline dehydrogenase